MNLSTWFSFTSNLELFNLKRNPITLIQIHFADADYTRNYCFDVQEAISLSEPPCSQILINQHASRQNTRSIKRPLLLIIQIINIALSSSLMALNETRLFVLSFAISSYISNGWPCSLLNIMTYGNDKGTNLSYVKTIKNNTIT